MITVSFNAATLADFHAALDLLASHPAASMGITTPPALSVRKAGTPAYAGDTSTTDGLPPVEYYKRERGDVRFRMTRDEREQGLSQDEAASVRMENPDWRTAKAGADDGTSPPIVAPSVSMDESEAFG